MIWLLLACSGEVTLQDDTAAADTQADTDSGGGGDSEDTVPDSVECADAPTVTWANFGEGFLLENCQACHASTSRSRNGAPEDVVFDTEADAATHLVRILATATGDAPTMPPAGGVSAEDRYLLETWLTCHPPTP